MAVFNSILSLRALSHNKCGPLFHLNKEFEQARLEPRTPDQEVTSQLALYLCHKNLMVRYLGSKNKLGCFGLDAKLTWHEIDKNLYFEQTSLLSNGKNHLSAQSPKKPHSNKPKWFHILYGKRYVFHFTRQGLGLNFSSRRRRVWVKKAFFCYSDNHFCLSGRNTFDAFWVLKQIFK